MVQPVQHGGVLAHQLRGQGRYHGRRGHQADGRHDAQSSPARSRGATRSRQDHPRTSPPTGGRWSAAPYRSRVDRPGDPGAAPRRDQRGAPGLAVRVAHPRAHRPARGLPAGPWIADERPEGGHLPGRGDALRRSRQLRPAADRAGDGRGGAPHGGLLARGGGRRGLPRSRGRAGPAPTVPRSWPRPRPARAALGAPAGRLGAPLDPHLRPLEWLAQRGALQPGPHRQVPALVHPARCHGPAHRARARLEPAAARDAHPAGRAAGHPLGAVTRRHSSTGLPAGSRSATSRCRCCGPRSRQRWPSAPSSRSASSTSSTCSSARRAMRAR